MPWVCNREGCGKRIEAKDGSPDNRKHFRGAACLGIDKRERLLAKRIRLKDRRRSQCGRKPVPGSRSNGGMKLHNPRAGTSAVAAGVQARGQELNGSEGHLENLNDIYNY